MIGASMNGRRQMSERRGFGARLALFFEGSALGHWRSRPFDFAQGDNRRRRGRTPRFYQTKPFVMLKKMHLYWSERKGCADYRKMTNSFVFLEMRAAERTRIRLTRTLCPKERNRSKCMLKTQSFSFAPLERLHIIR